MNKQTVARREISKKIRLPGGQPVSVKIEYVHATGDPSLHISWSGPDFRKQVLTPVKGAHPF